MEFSLKSYMISLFLSDYPIKTKTVIAMKNSSSMMLMGRVIVYLHWLLLDVGDICNNALF